MRLVYLQILAGRPEDKIEAKKLRAKKSHVKG
jgi:hypothetical protein